MSLDRILRFRRFTIDPIRRQLFHDTERVRLVPRAFDLLFYMAENAGRVVTKSDLLNAVWSGSVIGESNLTQTVFLVRECLRAHDPCELIITVPGAGYQFGVTVTRSERREPEECERSLANDPVRPANGILVAQASGIVQSAIRDKGTRSARAFADIARAHCMLATVGRIAPRLAFAVVETAALAAFEIDPNEPWIYASLGYLRCHQDRDWTMAEQHFLRAIDAYPDDVAASHWYGEMLAARGRFDQSLEVLNKAQRRAPDSAVISTSIGQTLFYARDYKACIGRLKTVLHIHPDRPSANMLLGSAYRQTGRLKDAIRILERANSGHDNLSALATLADAYSAAGYHIEASRSLRLVSRLGMTRYTLAYALAYSTASTAPASGTIDLLERANEERDYWTLWLNVKPNLDSIRQEPKFRDLLRKANLAP